MVQDSFTARGKDYVKGSENTGKVLGAMTVLFGLAAVAETIRGDLPAAAVYGVGAGAFALSYRREKVVGRKAAQVFDLK